MEGRGGWWRGGMRRCAGGGGDRGGSFLHKEHLIQECCTNISCHVGLRNKGLGWLAR